MRRETDGTQPPQLPSAEEGSSVCVCVCMCTGTQACVLWGLCRALWLGSLCHSGGRLGQRETGTSAPWAALEALGAEPSSEKRREGGGGQGRGWTGCGQVEGPVGGRLGGRPLLPHLSQPSVYDVRRQMCIFMRTRLQMSSLVFVKMPLSERKEDEPLSHPRSLRAFSHVPPHVSPRAALPGRPSSGLDGDPRAH